MVGAPNSIYVEASFRETNGLAYKFLDVNFLYFIIVEWNDAWLERFPIIARVDWAERVRIHSKKSKS